MIARLTPSVFSGGAPRVAALMGGGSVAERIQELEWFGPEFAHQMDCDLKFLDRRLGERNVSAAYRDLLRNRGRLRDALYEIRAAAMLATVASDMTLTPGIGSRKADARCVIEASRLFVEVTTWVDTWPRPPERVGVVEVHDRAIVQRSFNPAPAPPYDRRYLDVPASQKLRARIADEAGQLPADELSLIVLGAPDADLRDVDAALFGDGYSSFTPAGSAGVERFKNGLFAIPDDIGGVSRIAGLVWLKLVPVRSGVRVHSRLFCNPQAAHPIPPKVKMTLESVFDRRAVLWSEIDRITRCLIERYGAQRIILFGSLATERRTPGEWVHQWSDIDLAVVANAERRFSDRIGEVLRLVRPRVGLNVLVYTPDEFARAEREGGFFVRDEILARGHRLYP
jgi:predicted nucleotidyltransferase